MAAVQDVAYQVEGVLDAIPVHVRRADPDRVAVVVGVRVKVAN